MQGDFLRRMVTIDSRRHRKCRVSRSCVFSSSISIVWDIGARFQSDAGLKKRYPIHVLRYLLDRIGWLKFLMPRRYAMCEAEIRKCKPWNCRGGTFVFSDTSRRTIYLEHSAGGGGDTRKTPLRARREAFIL